MKLTQHPGSSVLVAYLEEIFYIKPVIIILNINIFCINTLLNGAKY